MRPRSVTLGPVVPVGLLPSKDKDKDKKDKDKEKEKEKEKDKEKERGKLLRQKSLGRMSRSKINPQLVCSLADVVEAPKKETHNVTLGAASELTEMLIWPDLVSKGYWADYFYSLQYIMEPSKFLAFVVDKLEGPKKAEWTKVLFYWVESHFYYFSASHTLMSELLRNISRLGTSSK